MATATATTSATVVPMLTHAPEAYPGYHWHAITFALCADLWHVWQRHTRHANEAERIMIRAYGFARLARAAVDGRFAIHGADHTAAEWQAIGAVFGHIYRAAQALANETQHTWEHYDMRRRMAARDATRMPEYCRFARPVPTREPAPELAN